MSLITKFKGFFRKNQQNTEKEELTRVRLYIGKFVKQKNIDIGESIALEHNRLIIKNQERIVSIPQEAIIKTEDNIILGDFDMEESIKLGKEWADRKDTLKFDDKGMLIK